MKLVRRVLAAALIVASFPSVAGADPSGTGPLTVSPSSVNFGPVLAPDPDCQPGSPFPGCTKAVLVVTNTSGEPVFPRSQSVCATIILNPDSCNGGSWGGLTTDPPENTCMSVIDPGESCQVTILGLPATKGVIRGFYVMGDESGTFILIVPVEVLGTVNCLGVLATILGTRGDDVGLVGTAGADVIAGRGGNDVISGDADDTVCGGHGIDEISGAGIALGGPGNDALIGGAGDQVLFGGGGGDSIDADVGNDRANGGEGDDTITDGEDHCVEVCGDDVFSGGPGDDHIAAGAGSDRALGGPGDDSVSVVDVSGSRDADFVNGGDGFDTCVVDQFDTYKNCEVVEVVPT